MSQSLCVCVYVYVSFTPSSSFMVKKKQNRKTEAKESAPRQQTPVGAAELL